MSHSRSAVEAAEAADRVASTADASAMVATGEAIPGELLEKPAGEGMIALRTSVG